MANEQAQKVLHCERCNVRIRLATRRNPDAKMLRLAKEPKGLCINCAVHNWLQNTYPVNILLAKSGPGCLAHQHIRDQFTEIMRSGRADANPDEINWNLLSDNWDLPFPNKVKPSAANPCTQQKLDDIKSGKEKAFEYPPDAVDPLRGVTTITSFNQLNLFEDGLGDKVQTLLKGSTMSRKKTSTNGEQLPLIDVGPENLKKIVPVARRYRAAVKRRMNEGDEEVKLKVKLLQLVEEANLQRDKTGKVKFKADGMTITVTPRDNLIQVTEKKDSAE